PPVLNTVHELLAGIEAVFLNTIYDNSMLNDAQTRSAVEVALETWLMGAVPLGIEYVAACTELDNPPDLMVWSKENQCWVYDMVARVDIRSPGTHYHIVLSVLGSRLTQYLVN
ncbi:hypothetical protein ACQKAJ_08135, partial [Helicobacter pylori]